MDSDTRFVGLENEVEDGGCFLGRTWRRVQELVGDVDQCWEERLDKGREDVVTLTEPTLSIMSPKTNKKNSLM